MLPAARWARGGWGSLWSGQMAHGTVKQKLCKKWSFFFFFPILDQQEVLQVGVGIGW